jgi:hypothetical protein
VRALLAAAAFALAACGQSAQQTPETPEAPVYDVRIGPEGAAGITTDLPMDLAAIQAAAPGYTAAEIQDQIGDYAFTAITLSADGEEIFRVYPARDGPFMHVISTTSNRARGPRDEVIGVTRYGDALPSDLAFCVSEQINGGPGFACAQSREGGFYRVYSLPASYTGPTERFDAIEPEGLEGAVLAKMRWASPRTVAATQ